MNWFTESAGSVKGSSFSAAASSSCSSVCRQSRDGPAENGADFPSAAAAGSSGSFLGLGGSFPAGLAAELFGRADKTPPAAPPPPQLSEQPAGSAISVVTGVQHGGTVSSQNTPLADDNDYVSGGRSVHGDDTRVTNNRGETRTCATSHAIFRCFSDTTSLAI